MTHYIGFCDTCHVARSFTTADARAEWETTHPHQEES